MKSSLFFFLFNHDWYNAPKKPVEDMDSELEIMFDAQRALMEACGVQDIPADIALVVTSNALAAEVAESTEFFNDITKPWKKVLAVDVEHSKEEVIDEFHFIMQKAIILGMTWEEFFALYMKKNAVNWQRINQKLRGANA